MKHPPSRRSRLTVSAGFVVLATFAVLADIGNAQVPSPLNVTKVAADPTRPLVYGLHQNGAGAGAVVVYDTVSRTVTHGVPVADFPTDLAIRPDGSALYVLNTGSKSISKIDLSSLSVVKTTSLAQFATWGTDITVTPGKIGLGPGDVVFYTDGAWGPALHAVNFETGQHLQKTQFTGPGDSDGFGDFVVSPSGEKLFAWKQYGWTAGILSTFVARYGISGAGLLTFEAKGNDERLGSWDRNPLNTPALMDSSGDTLLIKNRVVDQTDPRTFLRSFPEPIYALSPGGQVAGAVGKLYHAPTADALAVLPDLGTVQCFSRDGSLLVYFKDTSATFEVLDLVPLLGLDLLEMPMSPSGFSVAPSPTSFEWFARDGTDTYRVFLGTSEAAVEAAGPGSDLIIGETSDLSFPYPSILAAGTYYWRVDAITQHGVLKGAVVPFTVSPLSLSVGSLDFGTLLGVTTAELSIDLAKSGDSEVDWTATANNAWISLGAVSGTTPSEWQVMANLAGLAPGRHEGSITMEADGSAFEVPVSVRIEALNYTHLEADGQLPYLYGISQVSENTTSPAYLLRIDAASGEVLDSVAVGSSVSDLTIHYPENRIYVTNWMTGKLRALDRDTLEEVQEYPFTPFAGVSTTGDVYRISAGAAGRLVVEEKDQWINLRLINTATGAVLATRSSVREGGGAMDPTGRYYFHGDNNSSGAEFHRFDTAGDSFVKLNAVRTTGVSSNGSRTVKRSADGTRFYWNGTAHDAQLNVLWTINEVIQAASLHGDAVFTPGKVRNGATGQVLADLPVTTSIMAISGDQQNLFLASGGNLTVVDLSTLIDPPGQDLQPSLVDGSTVIGVEQTLGWSLDSFATSYRVYFGTSLAAVQAADETSAEYLGTVSGGELQLPWDLDLGGEYFWRVDAVGFLGAATGPVWSFEVAPIEVHPSHLSISIPEGLSTTRQIELTVAAPLAWTATVPSPGPLALDLNGGTTSATLEVTVDVAGLAVGPHSTSITFTADGKAFDLPVAIEVLSLNYTHLEADGQLPYLYGISQVSENTTSPAYLLRIDAASGEVLDSVAVGSSVSDLTIHYPENRIYVTNWMTGKLRALDRDTLETVQEYSFTPFSGTATTGDVYRISAGAAGRLLVEEKDQWINLRLINTATGAVLATRSSVREGGGVTDPTGRYYFHGDNNSSDASLRRFDTNGDSFHLINSVRTVGVSVFGSRTVKRSADGTRYYWNGTAHDAQLNVLWTINEVIQAASLHGDVVFTPGKLRNGATGQVLADLPVTTSIMAISGDQQNLFLASGGNLTVVDLSTLIDLPGQDGLQPSLVDGSTVIGMEQTLGWSLDPFATSYRVYFGTSLAAVQAADESSAEYQGTVSGGEFQLPWNLDLGGQYFWRVDPVGFLGAVAGPVWSFEVAPIEINPSHLSISIPVGLSTTRQIELSAPTPQPWTASVSSPGPLALDHDTGTTPATVELTVDAAGLSVGPHSSAVTFTAEGKTFDVPVAIEVLSLNYTHLEADGQLPYLYGISQVSESSISPAHLLRIDAGTGQVLDSVAVGSSVSDLAIHYPENRIYVTNWMTGKLRALDRDTLEEVQEYPFTPFAGASTTGDVYRISAGAAGRLLVEEKDQWINLRLINTATGAVLATRPQVREGGGVMDPAGRYYFHGDNNSSDASLRRFDTNGDSLQLLNSVRTTGVSFYGSRTVKRSPDGTRYYWNGTAHDAQLNVLWTINEVIQAASLHGDVVFTPGKLRNGATGQVLADLPVTTSIMAISRDQQNLFLASGGNLTVLELSTLIDLPGQDLQPSLADGSTVIGMEQTLGWSLDPFATSYKVYFGTSLAAVQAADESSAEYLGTVSGGAFQLPWNLDLGGQYFWRVDAAGFIGTSTGAVWSFEVAPIEIHPSHLSISIPVGLSTTQQIELSTPTPQTWSASVPSPGPLALDLDTGTTPATVELTVDAAGLSLGSHSSAVTFTAEGKTFDVPVEIEVLSLNYTHLEADGQLPYLYGISQVSESSISPAHLLRIDAGTGEVLDSVAVGSSVSDLAIHYPENRIYVTNWMTGKLRALDRDTLETVQEYSFTPFSGTATTGDVYRISAGVAGRLVVEEKDQWINLRLINTATGAVLATRPQVRQGGGVMDPAGRYYFHGDSNISDASLRRFDTNGGSFQLLNSVRTTGISHFGDRTVVMSRDGTRIFWNGTAHDAGLNVLWTGNQRIHAATADGRVVFVPGKALSGRTGTDLATLPVATSLIAVGCDQDKLFLASGSTLTLLDLQTLIDPPGEQIVPSIPDGSTVIGENLSLIWAASPHTDTYKVFIGLSQSAVDVADESSPEYLGEFSLTQLNLLGLIASGNTYFWRVDAVGFMETVKGEIWSFGVEPATMQPDVMVGSRPGRGLGDNRYSATGVDKVVRTRLQGKRRGNVFFWVQNDGNVNDHFSLTSSRGNRDLDVTYRRLSPSPANITAAITRPGGSLLANQAPGSKAALRATVRKAKSSRRSRASLVLLFRAVSAGNGSSDAARGMIRQSD